MKKWVILFVLLLIPLVCAQENYNGYETITAQVDISNEIEMQGSGYDVSYLEASLSFFPRSYAHQIVSSEYSSSPSADVQDNVDNLIFRWEENSASYTYLVSSEVIRERNFVKVYNKEDFPVETNSVGYIDATEFIDLNEDIEAQALEIVQGKDDLYEVVFKLANWTKENIEYDLNTLTEDAVQSSSWVLENEEGVCDELTNLFISFCRSLDIPARFVSGMAYTNTLEDFGPHGWAEVYINDEWISFDVTYGQLGWVDPTHIKFKDAFDSGESSASFEWSGKDIDLEIGELDVEVELISASGEGEKYLDVTIESLADGVGEGSYVPIQINLINENSFYVPVKLALTKAPEVVGDNVKSVLLKPGEEKNVFWIVKVEENPDSGLIYTTYVEVETMYGGVANNSFTYSLGSEVLSFEEANNLISGLMIDEDIEVLEDIELNCNFDKDAYYENENGVLTCEVVGEVENVCFANDCKTEEFVWDLSMEDYDSKKYVIIANQKGGMQYVYVELKIIKDPNLKLQIEPLSFDYNEEVDFTFNIITEEEVSDLFMELDNYGTVQVEKVDGEYTFNLKIPGERFANGKIKAKMNYIDTLGKNYETIYETDVTVNNIPFFKKIVLFFENLFS